MPSAIIQKLIQQQNKLIEQIPALQYYFLNIYLEEWNTFVPFLPIRCFRDFDIHSCFSEETSEQFKIFLSSGSTGNKRSRHIFSQEALKKYENKTCVGFSQFLSHHHLAKETPIISFVPPPHVWPTSSLAAMIDMFKQNNFQVFYCDIEEKKENLISCLKNISTGSACIFFGTTFHHLMLASHEDENFKEEVQKHFKRLAISIIDTGGTKGRTQAFTLEQTQEILTEFYTSPHFSFFSEYGMCELSSQAWSTKKIHDKSFTCNETLFPFSISIDKNKSLNLGEKGFIGFIDLVNEESWGAIITEDIGFKYSEKSFHLIGRGPDASMKGCSLNVQENFVFAQEKKLSKAIALPFSLTEVQPEIPVSLKIDDICRVLKKEKKWDHYSIQDFKKIAISIENGIPFNPTLKDKNLFYISAANTPIAWLFPYLIAARSGAKSITIKVPSLRLDDYYAQSMTKKTLDLIDIISRNFLNTTTLVNSHRSITCNFDNYDIVLAFGTNETLQTILKKINMNKTHFIGNGDIKNSLSVNVNQHLSSEIVALCSLWHGRGCRTPVALFLEGSSSDIQLWSQQFFEKLEEEFFRRTEIDKINFMQGFVHAHNCAYVRGQIRQLGQNDYDIVFRGQFTCVVNLTALSAEENENIVPDFGFGGCGFVYLLSSPMKDKFSELRCLSIVPEIGEYSF